MEKVSIEIANNDVYFMEVLDEIFIINENYDGLLIYDFELNQIDRIQLFEDITIYSSYKKGKEILLFCPDNDCLVYVDFASKNSKQIPMGMFEKIVFSSVYWWENTDIFLVDYEGHSYKVDVEENRIYEVKKERIEYREVFDKIVSLSTLKVLKIYNNQKRALIQLSDEEIAVIDFNGEIQTIKKVDQEIYFDFEVENECLLKLAENSVEVLCRGEINTYTISEQYFFVKGKCIVCEGELYALFLYADKSNIMCTKIEKVKLF